MNHSKAKQKENKNPVFKYFSGRIGMGKKIKKQIGNRNAGRKRKDPVIIFPFFWFEKTTEIMH